MIDYLLRTGIPASGVVLVWLAADRLRGTQLPARWLHRMLILAMLLYLIPLWPLLPRTTSPAPVTVPPSTVTAPAPDVDGTTILPAMTERPTPVPAPDVSEELLTSLTTVWTLGAATFLAVQTGRAVRFRRRILRDSREASSEAAAVLEDCRRTLDVRRTVRLWENPHIRSPLVMGLFRPVILLPAIPLDASELRCAFLHELTHLRRHDLWMRRLALLVTALHWYNPCVHLLRRGIRQTSEQACDEQLADILSRPERIAYGFLLLRLVDQETRPQAASLSARDLLERRLQVMLRPKQRNPRLLALVLAVLMVVCVCTACAVREPLVEPPATVRTGVTIDRNQAVWFRPEDIHDLQAVELVWWSDSVGIPPDDGGIVRMMRSYSPQDDAAAFDWLETHFGTATAPRAYVSGCCHSTLYLQRTDGVLGKVLVSDSANHAAFQSDEVVFTWSDGDGQAFFDLFGLDGDRLPSYPILPEEEAPRAHFLF